MDKSEGVQQGQIEEEATTSKECQQRISESQVKENEQKQMDELLVIESIFDESTLTIDHEKRCGRFIAYPEVIESPFHIIFHKSGKSTIPNHNEVDEANCDVQKIEVKYLPRIEFTFALDDLYPSDGPPAYLISCQWLSSSNMSKICEQLDTIYNESRSEILYSWFTFLRDDVLSFLNSDKELDVSWLLNNCNTPQDTTAAYNKNYIPTKCRGDAKYDNRVVLNESTPNILRILKGTLPNTLIPITIFLFLIFCRSR